MLRTFMLLAVFNVAHSINHVPPLLVAAVPEAEEGSGKSAPAPSPTTASESTADAVLPAAVPFWRHPIVRRAARRAIGGGLSGYLAGVIQVVCLMWLRTAMNYQCARQLRALLHARRR
jgi:hypothetical protein